MNDGNAADRLLQRVARLKTYRSGERRAPHKPLLLLMAIARLLQGHSRLTFKEVEERLTPLLKAYAPPVAARHQPELPYWHLRSDGLWEVDRAVEFPRQKGGFPTMGALRSSAGHLPEAVADLLRSDPFLVQKVVGAMLDEHFPPSVHDDILAAVGLACYVHGHAEETRPMAFRDPAFRQAVLRAYEHRCAFSGFRAALAGSYFGCEAAHVQWHAYDGPDIVANGIALEPTIHKLFDAGAWSLTDDRRIIVSANYTGSSVAVQRLRERHGAPLRSPLPGEPLVASEFIRWHREPNLGGIFRQPALPLEVLGRA
jgi:putative restriction endonuclease